MPFGLGFFAAAGAGAAGGADYRLIQSVILTSNQSTVTFSSIPQTFRHLQVRWVAKCASQQADLDFRINGITTSTYISHRLFGDGSNLNTNAEGVGFDRIMMPQAIVSSFTANVFASGIMDITDYTSTNKLKTVRMVYGHNDFPRLYFRSGLETSSTAAITSISFTPGGGTSHAVGTRYSLYGLV